VRCDRRGLLVGAAAALATPAWSRDPADLILSGRLVQGGFVMGRTWPRALIFIDGEALTTASADGVFVVGFDRDASPSVLLEARSGQRTERRTLPIARGSFPSTSGSRPKASPVVVTRTTSAPASTGRSRPSGSPVNGVPSGC